MEVEGDLEGLVKKCHALQEERNKLASELKTTSSACKEATTQARADHEVLQQVRQIAAAKPYLLRCVFGDHQFAHLTQVWCSSEAFRDLPRSASDAGSYFAIHPEEFMEKTLWVQCQEPEHPPLLNN